MRALAVAFPVALASLALAGCIGAPPPAPAVEPAPAPPLEAPAPPTLSLAGCRGALHVWLLPLEQLRMQVPVGYTVEEYAAEGAATGMGRLAFYSLHCGGDGAGLRVQNHGAAPMFGLLGVKLAPPAPDGATAASNDPGVPEGALAFYAIQLYAQQHDLEAALRAAPFPLLVAEHSDSMSPLPALDLPAYAEDLTAEDGSTFHAEVRGAPPAPEPYARLIRAFHEADGTVGVLDLNLTADIWEAAGTYEASADGAVARVIGAAVPVMDHHIIVDVQATVTAWTMPAADHDHAPGAPPGATTPPLHGAA